MSLLLTLEKSIHLPNISRQNPNGLFFNFLFICFETLAANIFLCCFLNEGILKTLRRKEKGENAQSFKLNQSFSHAARKRRPPGKVKKVNSFKNRLSFQFFYFHYVYFQLKCFITLHFP